MWTAFRSETTNLIIYPFLLRILQAVIGLVDLLELRFVTACTRVRRMLALVHSTQGHPNESCSRPIEYSFLNVNRLLPSRHARVDATQKFATRCIDMWQPSHWCRPAFHTTFRR